MVFLMSPALMLAQATASGNGSLTGRVTDSTGAVVAGASLTLTDTATNISQTIQSNSQGIYFFRDLSPGTYNLAVTHPGFRRTAVPNMDVAAGATLTIDVALEVGAVTETVQVTATAEAELQTLNATMGQALEGSTIMQLPTINRDVSSLVFLQPTASPTFGGAEGNTTSGNIAGSAADQNTYMLDGGNNTSDLDGDNGGYVGLRSGAMPTPVESVEEFRVNTNNMTADFSSSGGAQIQITTKRGTNQFHGSLYDWFQSDWLSSNDWNNNFYGTPKPKSHYNRFGGSFGGPMLPDFLGGKTYFFLNYEGERYPRTGPFTKTVPSDLLRKGIIQVRDATGTPVQYDLATAMVCGANGNQACDPRGIGLNPIVNQMWSKYLPEPNDFLSGDRLNTFGYRSNLTFPLSTNFGVVRIDHDFGPKWRFFGSYRYFRQDNPDTHQVDVGGLLPGDTLGKAAAVTSTPDLPRYLVTGVTTTISPSVTNEFHFSYLRNFWQWLRPGAVPQIPGIPAALGIGGESGSALIPMNIDTQNARQRLWAGHDFDYRDNINWLRGTHLFQFGGEFFHQWFHFDRYDNVVGGLTQLVYDISGSGIDTTAYQPIGCTAAVTTNCLPADKVSTPGGWNALYAETLGMMDTATVVATRTGANLSLNPLGTPLASYQIVDTYSVYFNDAWKIRPNLTLNYGLNWGAQMPPYDLHREQGILVDPNNAILTAQDYLANRQAAALNGQVYSPALGFTPIGAVGSGLKYPFAPYYGAFQPRVSVAWNPDFGQGFLGTLLGHKNTVLRAGYGRFYSKDLPINLITSSVLGDGFLQPAACKNPDMSGACKGTGGVTPATAFRIGVDGNSVPISLPQTLSTPVQPGINAAYSNFSDILDSKYRPADSDQVDISIQRQLRGGFIAEVGYVGIWAHHLYSGVDLGNMPVMMTLGGQTFAKAYAAIYNNVKNNPNNITPQPWFEAALNGSSYCTGFSSCTAAVAAKTNERSNILGQNVTNIVSDLDGAGAFTFPTILASTNQCFYCFASISNGYSNYNALTATVAKRYSNNLSLNANFTYGHALGILELNQTYTLSNLNNAWNLGTDYGPQPWDRKFTFNLLGTYTLPFGKGQRWANSNPVATRVLGGWAVSPIFSFGTGLALPILTGSFQEWGNAFDGDSCGAVPLNGSVGYSNSLHSGVLSDGNIGVNGDTTGNANLFSNPTAIYNNFRPYILGRDGGCGGGGILRGQMRWNLDLGVTKETTITERVKLQLYMQAFNVLNHMQWGDPSSGGNCPVANCLNIADPADFGVLPGQYGALTLGGFGASANYTRIIQLGVRFAF